MYIFLLVILRKKTLWKMVPRDDVQTLNAAWPMTLTWAGTWRELLDWWFMVKFRSQGQVAGVVSGAQRWNRWANVVYGYNNEIPTILQCVERPVSHNPLQLQIVSISFASLIHDNRTPPPSFSDCLHGHFFPSSFGLSSVVTFNDCLFISSAHFPLGCYLFRL